MRKRDVMTIAVAGGAGVAIYLVVQKQRQTRVAALMAAQAAGVPPAKPSLFDVILGQVPDIVKGFMDKSKELEKTIAARGADHLKAWRGAVSRGDKYYAVVGPSVTLCYETATGNTAQAIHCPATQLEGLWRR